MSISQKEVEYVADLARLRLGNEEKIRLSDQLSHIIDYMAELNQVDTKGVDLTVSVVGGTKLLREDNICPSLTQEKAIENAPDSKDGFFRVPKIISER